MFRIAAPRSMSSARSASPSISSWSFWRTDCNGPAVWCGGRKSESVSPSSERLRVLVLRSQNRHHIARVGRAAALRCKCPDRNWARRHMPLRGRDGLIGVFRWHKTLPQLLGGHEAGADQLAPSPDQRANPEHLAARGEGEAEYLRHRQRADIEANPALGNVEDHALDPRRIRCRDQEAGLVQVDPDILACAEAFAVSRHRFLGDRSAPRDKPREPVVCRTDIVVCPKDAPECLNAR